MPARKSKLPKLPVPMFRPPVQVTPSRARPFAIDCREYMWGGCAADIGDKRLSASYDPPDWRITSYDEREATRTARVHGLECTELASRELDRDRRTGRWSRATRHLYVRLTKRTAQCLASVYTQPNRRVLYTFLDDGFDRDWGELPRRLEDTGRLKRMKDGTFRLRTPAQSTDVVLGAGMFRVRVGERRFTCLRAIDLQWDANNPECGILGEGYFLRNGRAIMTRRYNGRLWAIAKPSSLAGPPWDERFPENHQMVINGATFVHWYDVLNDLALGVPKAKLRKTWLGSAPPGGRD